MSGRAARLAVLGLVALGCTRAASADGLVWAIEGKRSTLYLAGSVHLLKRDDAALPAALTRAYADADVVVMELDLDDLDPAEAGRWLMTRGTYSDDRTLRDTLGEERHRRLGKASAELGMPIEALERFEPWAVALTLIELAYSRLSFDPDSGVERQIERLAARDGKEILGLESVEDQLGLLDALSLEDQRRFLDETVEEIDTLAEETERVLKAWRAGDLGSLEKLLAEEYAEFPSLYRALVLDRNARWMPRIEQLARAERDHLVVVGVLHLIGDEGLVALAKKRGLKPKPLH